MWLLASEQALPHARPAELVQMLRAVAAAPGTGDDSGGSKGAAAHVTPRRGQRRDARTQPRLAAGAAPQKGAARLSALAVAEVAERAGGGRVGGAGERVSHGVGGGQRGVGGAAVQALLRRWSRRCCLELAWADARALSPPQAQVRGRGGPLGARLAQDGNARHARFVAPSAALALALQDALLCLAQLSDRLHGDSKPWAGGRVAGPPQAAQEEDRKEEEEEEEEEVAARVSVAVGRLLDRCLLPTAARDLLFGVMDGRRGGGAGGGGGGMARSLWEAHAGRAQASRLRRLALTLEALVRLRQRLTARQLERLLEVAEQHAGLAVAAPGSAVVGDEGEEVEDDVQEWMMRAHLALGVLQEAPPVAAQV